MTAIRKSTGDIGLVVGFTLDKVELVEAHAHRKLRQLASYRKVSGVEDLPAYAKSLPLRQGERVLGVYENSSSLHQYESVIVTTVGLFILTDQSTITIDYDQIENIKRPSVEKTDLRELLVHAKSGQVITVPVREGHGKVRDAWPFSTFLLRVTNGIRKRCKNS